MNSHRSVLFATPSTSRKLNATYVKSQMRDTFPEYTDASKNKHLTNMNNNLKDIGLPGTCWETYRVNALYDFSYEKAKLKHYEKILKSVIENDLSKNECESQHISQNCEVKIQCFRDMTFTDGDYEPLKIKVDIENEAYQSSFIGILLSVGRKEGFMEKERTMAGAIILPLFLVDYTDKIILESVMWFLQDNFSCLVNPLKFSSNELVWMLALFCPKNDDNCEGTTVVEYNIPFEELKSIEYFVDSLTIAKIWKRVSKPDAKEISENQVFKFISFLEQHFYDMFSINVSDLDIQLIKTPLARVKADHSIVPSDDDKLYFVIRHLTHLAQEILK